MEVRATCRWVAEHASHVTINNKGIEKVAEEINGNLPDVKWDFEGIHFFDNGPLTAQYLLVLDALNFCFWPDDDAICLNLLLTQSELERKDGRAGVWTGWGWRCTPRHIFWKFDVLKRASAFGAWKCTWPGGMTAKDEELHYEHLARGLKRALEVDNTAFDASRLQTYTGTLLRQLLQWPRKLPLEEERARLIREVGSVLEKHFDGLASNLIAAADHSAVALVELVACHFPGFRDHAVYKSRQVFIYKRAQIFVADLWGAFKGEGLGAFKDINRITMFADYVVPAVLRHWGILEYSSSLAAGVDGQKEIAPGSEEEVEIRAGTITAVEQLRETLCKRLGKEVTSVQVDWWLWSSGIESMEASSFHRTLTVYY